MSLRVFFYSGHFLERGGPDSKNSGQNKRIPAGTYSFTLHTSTNKFKNNRAKLTSSSDPSFVQRAILIHPGNYYYDTEGCLLPGTSFQSPNSVSGDYSVQYSKYATNLIEQYIQKNSWNVALTITNRF